MYLHVDYFGLLLGYSWKCSGITAHGAQDRVWNWGQTFYKAVDLTPYTVFLVPKLY